MGDIQLAIRSLLRSKLFTAVAVLTLAIGIGSTTAVFSVFSAIALRPLPLRDHDRLVDIEEWSATDLCEGCGVGLSLPMYRDIETNLRTLQATATSLELPVNVGGIDAPERVGGALISGNFFGVLGVGAELGRPLDPTDDQRGAPLVAVLSHRLFATRFGSDSTIVGRKLRLNGQPTMVVGVMAANAMLPEFAELWMPMAPLHESTDRSNRELGVIGRLRPGATVSAADAEMKALAANIAREHPDTQQRWSTRVRPLRQVLAGQEVALYGIMLGAVVVLLLIVCANIAGLMLARGLARRRDIAVRLALGARRSTIVWHLLAESVCLGLAGGAIGVLAASWTVDLLVAALGTQIPRWLEPKVDPTVVIFSLVISVLSAIAFGLVPALRASRPDVHGDLKAGTQAAAGPSGSRLRGSLVVLQLSLSLVLLAASGVLAVQVQRVTARSTGQNDHDVLQARIEMLGPVTNDQYVQTTSALVTQFAALPGARAAAAYGTGFIAGFGGHDVRIRADGIGEVPDGLSPRFYFAVTPRYFETVRLPVSSGRAFTDRDTRGSEPVVIVGQRLATLWNGSAALGRRIRLGSADSLPWLTIVGIVGDAGGSTRSDASYAYVPFAQAPQATATVLVGASGDPAPLARTMRDAAKAIDPDLPLLDLMTVEQDHNRQAWPYRAYSLIMTVFGTMALVLAAIGLYGLVAYGAEQRTREIGVRIALGAKRRDVVTLVTRQGAALVAVGIVLGIGGSLLVLPVMKSVLWQASPFNPYVFAGASLVLVLVAAVASYVPATRASRTDPMVALRSE